MKKISRAANIVKFAHSLNLQLFNDFDGTEPGTEEVVDEPVTEEVIPGSSEEPTEPIETGAAEPRVQPEVQGEPDITQTQAFSRRLKEETEKARMEIEDSMYASMYGEYGITSKAEYDQAIAEQQEQAIREKYGEEEADEIIDAIRFREENQPLIEQQREKERLYSEWTELTSEHKDIKDFTQVPNEAWQLSADKGIPLLDAYNRVWIKNQAALIEKTKFETEQETIKNINNNAATSAGSAAGGAQPQRKPVSEMTSEEFEAYKDEIRNRRRE
ncbi:MAG: hypothetical protein AB9836_05990 [Aminipila sp.]